MALTVSEIDLFSTLDLQMNNYWDFVILDNPDPTNVLATLGTLATDIFMKFKITNCSLPLPSLETEATKVGRKHYKSRNYEGDYTITVLEDTTFSSYNYFKNWMSKVYNFDTQYWESNPPSKTGILTYYDNSLTLPTGIFLYESLKIKGIGDLSQQRSESSPLTLTIALTFEKVSFVSNPASVITYAKTLESVLKQNK